MMDALVIDLTFSIYRNALVIGINLMRFNIHLML